MIIEQFFFCVNLEKKNILQQLRAKKYIVPPVHWRLFGLAWLSILSSTIRGRKRANSRTGGLLGQVSILSRLAVVNKPSARSQLSKPLPTIKLTLYTYTGFQYTYASDITSQIELRPFIVVASCFFATKVVPVAQQVISFDAIDFEYPPGICAFYGKCQFNFY
jgi:hypothetical protein